jgi:hypothetical protein
MAPIVFGRFRATRDRPAPFEEQVFCYNTARTGERAGETTTQGCNDSNVLIRTTEARNEVRGSRNTSDCGQRGVAELHRGHLTQKAAQTFEMQGSGIAEPMNRATETQGIHLYRPLSHVAALAMQRQRDAVYCVQMKYGRTISTSKQNKHDRFVWSSNEDGALVT